MRVRLFARARDLAGREALQVEIPNGATVGELRAELSRVCPALRELLPRCAVAVNEEFAENETHLADSFDVALIPPVSGG